MNEDAVDLETIRARIRLGNFSIRSHAVTHALKEGFDRQHIVEAVLNGVIIEEYPDAQRVLVCGKVLLMSITVYLHVICDYTDPEIVDFVTAYLPDESYWNNPPYSRWRKSK